MWSQRRDLSGERARVRGECLHLGRRGRQAERITTGEGVRRVGDLDHRSEGTGEIGLPCSGEDSPALCSAEPTGSDMSWPFAAGFAAPESSRSVSGARLVAIDRAVEET